MFAMTWPSFIDESRFAVHATQNPAALMTASVVALHLNVGVFVYMVYKIVKTRRKPYSAELYTDLACFKEIKKDTLPA
jgi:hypothetical protein